MPVKVRIDDLPSGGVVASEHVMPTGRGRCVTHNAAGHYLPLRWASPYRLHANNKQKRESGSGTLPNQWAMPQHFDEILQQITGRSAKSSVGTIVDSVFRCGRP
jgi:hypothetical protein